MKIKIITDSMSDIPKKIQDELKTNNKLLKYGDFPYI